MLETTISGRRLGAVLVAIALSIALAGGATGAPAASDGSDGAAVDSAAQAAAQEEVQPEYNVTLHNATVLEWQLTAVEVTNMTVRTLTIENATTENGSWEDIVLSNVSVDRLVVENGSMTNVTATELMVSDREVVDVPGGEVLGEFENETIERNHLENLTIDGLATRELTFENLSLEGMDRSDGEIVASNDGGVEVAEEVSGDAAIRITDADAEESRLSNVTVEGWTAEEVSVGNETVDASALD